MVELGGWREGEAGHPLSVRMHLVWMCSGVFEVVWVDRLLWSTYLGEGGDLDLFVDGG